LRLSIIDRYLAREFIEAFLVVLGICATVMFLNLFFESFEDIMENRPGLALASLYFLYRVPVELFEIFPFIGLLSILFSIGMMSKNNEVLAMHACGISYGRLCVPVAICGFVISLLGMAGNEKIVPACDGKARRLEARINNDDSYETETDVFNPETEGWVYYTEYYNSDLDAMARPKILRMRPDGSGPLRKIEARWGRLIDSERHEDADLWRFDEAVVWDYDPRTGDVLGVPRRQAVMRLKLPKSLDRLLERRKKPSEMDILELAGHVRVLQALGVKTQVYSTDLHHKITFPLSALLLILVGYTISVRAHVRPMVLGFSYGLVAGIIYYLCDAVCLKLGHEQLAPPAVVWAPNVAFLAVAAFRMRYVNQVRD
jgi:lipopolysaccharide export system permease protein